MKPPKVKEVAVIFAAFFLSAVSLPIEEVTAPSEPEEITTSFTTDYDTTIATEDSSLPLSSQNVEIRLEPQFLEPRIEDSERKPRQPEASGNPAIQDELERFQNDWPRVATKTTPEPNASKSVSVTMTQSTVSATSSTNRATPRKIMGFINFPLINAHSKDGLHKSGAHQHKDLVTAGPQWLYGPIKDVRKTLEHFGVPSTDGWLDLAKYSGTRYAGLLPNEKDSTKEDHKPTEANVVVDVQHSTLEPVLVETAKSDVKNQSEEIEENFSSSSTESSESVSLPSSDEVSSEVAEVPSTSSDTDEDFATDVDGHKYQVEEETADGYIVGEFGIVNKKSGNLRGVRYTAHSSIDPGLIQEALRTFLSL